MCRHFVEGIGFVCITIMLSYHLVTHEAAYDFDAKSIGAADAIVKKDQSDIVLSRHKGFLSLIRCSPTINYKYSSMLYTTAMTPFENSACP